MLGMMFVSVVFIPSAWAQDEEVICDPENPACVTTQEAVPGVASPADDAPSEPVKVSAEVEPDGEVEGGEETICDPENPACTPAQELKTPSPDEATPDDEVICDPENPACAAPQAPAQGIKAPPKLSEPEWARATPEFNQVEFLGTYGTSMAVDTAYDRGGEDIVEWSTGVNLKLSYDASARMRVVIEAQLRHWIGGKENLADVDWWFNAWDKRADYDLLLGESYVLYRRGAWSLRVGQLLTPWGSTDLTRPADIINPSDFRALGSTAPGTYQTRLAQPSATLTYAGQGWSGELLVVPFFTPDRVIVAGRDSGVVMAASPSLSARLPAFELVNVAYQRLIPAQSAPLSSQGAQSLGGAPPALPQNLSLGARLSGTIWNMDWGVGYLWGWDRTPWFEVDEDTRALLNLIADDPQLLADQDIAGFLARNPEAGPLTQRVGERLQQGESLATTEFLRRQLLMVELARYLGPVGVRADVAFSPAVTYLSRELRAFRAPQLHSALGLSYETFGDSYQAALTVEGFSLIPFGPNSWLTRAFVDETRRAKPGDEAIIFGSHLWGVSGGLVFEQTEWQLSANIGGIFNLSNEDFILNASISKRFNSLVRLTLGTFIYEGPDPKVLPTIGGLFDHNDHVFLGLDGSF